MKKINCRPQRAASREESERRMAELRTQGRKGCKAIRINMAFTPANHEFIKTVARATGKTMTEYTNAVIEKYRTEHPDLYNKACGICMASAEEQREREIAEARQKFFAGMNAAIEAFDNYCDELMQYRR